MTPGHAENELLDGAPPPVQEDQAMQRELFQVADGLARLLSLGAGLTGGGVMLVLGEFTLGLPFRLAVVLLLVATVCAVQGIQAGSGAGQLPPEQQREGLRLLLKKKEWWLHRAQTALLGGLGLAVAGMLLR